MNFSASVVIAGLALVCGCQIAPAGNHPVSINVTVRTESGDAIPEVPLTVTTGINNGYGLTDANGNLALTLQADDQSFHAVTARLWGVFRRPEVAHLRGLALIRYQELGEQYFFKTVYVEPVNASATQVNIQVTAYPAVTVTATLSVQPAESVRVIAVVEDGMFFDIVPTGTEAVFKGVRRGTAARLRFGLPGGETIWKDLTATQTQSDVALGAIVLQRHVADASLQLTVTNRANLSDETLIPIDDAVFLVRSDGQVVYDAMVHSNDQVIGGRYAGEPTHVLSIPAGSYYVVPGGPGGSQQKKLLAMISAGNLAALDAAGVPKIVIGVGPTVEASIDARQAYAAINAAGNP